jgi:hypothetical protein
MLWYGLHGTNWAWNLVAFWTWFAFILGILMSFMDKDTVEKSVAPNRDRFVGISGYADLMWDVLITGMMVAFDHPWYGAMWLYANIVINSAVFRKQD